MVVGVKLGKYKAKVRPVRHQYFINIVAVGIPVLKNIRIVAVGYVADIISINEFILSIMRDKDRTYLPPLALVCCRISTMFASLM